MPVQVLLAHALPPALGSLRGAELRKIRLHNPELQSPAPDTDSPADDVTHPRVLMLTTFDLAGTGGRMRVVRPLRCIVTGTVRPAPVVTMRPVPVTSTRIGGIEGPAPGRWPAPSTGCR